MSLIYYKLLIMNWIELITLKEESKRNSRIFLKIQKFKITVIINSNKADSYVPETQKFRVFLEKNITEFPEVVSYQNHSEIFRKINIAPKHVLL